MLHMKYCSKKYFYKMLNDRREERERKFKEKKKHECI